VTRFVWARTASAILATAFLAAAGVASAGELWSRGDASLSVSGSLRQIVLYSKQTDASQFGDAIADDIATNGVNTTCVAADGFEDCPAFDLVNDEDIGQGFTRLRLEADLTMTEWLSAYVVYDNEIQFGMIDTLESDLSSGFGSQSFIDAESSIHEGQNHDWNHSLYRGYVQIETERFELAVGRQRIAWGVGRLWNPIDRFSALPPLSLQPDVTPGIDSIDGRFNFDGFNFLQVVYAPGDSRREERWAVRLHGVVWDADLSAMAGMFEEAPTFGVDFARNLGDGAIGLEAVYTAPDHKVWMLDDPGPRKLHDFWQIVVSYDINLAFGEGIYLLVEYLYNGNGLGSGQGRAGPIEPLFEATNTPPNPVIGGLIPGPYATAGSSDIFGSSRVITNAEHQIGTQLGYDLTPELRSNLVTLVDISHGSAAFFPNLAYSPLDSLEITLGVQLFAGQQRSQYGSSEPLVYLLADWYF
jgi:hypothetical protein